MDPNKKDYLSFAVVWALFLIIMVCFSCSSPQERTTTYVAGEKFVSVCR